MKRAGATLTTDELVRLLDEDRTLDTIVVGSYALRLRAAMACNVPGMPLALNIADDDELDDDEWMIEARRV